MGIIQTIKDSYLEILVISSSSMAFLLALLCMMVLIEELSNIQKNKPTEYENEKSDYKSFFKVPD